MVLFTHQQNIICSQTQLDDIAHEQTIICSQLFAGHMVGFRPMKRKNNLHRMTIDIIVNDSVKKKNTCKKYLWMFVKLIGFRVSVK